MKYLLLLACLIAIAGCEDEHPPVTPTLVQPSNGWSMSQTLTWGAPGPNVYILTSPDGQRFLVTGNGGICPYPVVPTPAENPAPAGKPR